MFDKSRTSPKAYFLGVIAAVLFLQACTQESDSEVAAAAEEIELTTLEQRFSYTVGADLAQNLKQSELPVDEEILIAAFREVYGGSESKMTAEEMAQANQEITQQLRAKATEEQGELAEQHKSEGEQFLADNAGKEGVMQTDSGLQYKIITDSEGIKPRAEDTVTVHYRGTLLDGTEFDSSYGRGEPASFPLGNVIRGWTEGLQLMGEGAKFEFYIPSDLAYGPGGRPGIPPNATLVFEVELLKAKEETAE